MRTKSIIVIFLLTISVIFIYSTSFFPKEDKADPDSNGISVELEANLTLENTIDIEQVQKPPMVNKEDVLSFIGMTKEQIVSILGEPIRMDRSSYDYDWWIYNEDYKKYLQIGIEDDLVVTIYVIGEDLNIEPFYIGQTMEELKSKIEFNNKLAFSAQNNSYRFELNDTELAARPLLELNGAYVQLYFDTFTNKLSSIRIMDNLTLIKQRPYELIYRGELLSAKELSSKEWEDVEKGSAAQILDITNVIRKRHGLNPVIWDEKTSNVAYKHSKDMKDDDYFSHTSPSFGGLADRLAAGEVVYQLAGENIAAMYVDGIAAVEGWLNSEGHRETLLNEKFTHLGVGVYKKYYTQNFIQKWE